MVSVSLQFTKPHELAYDQEPETGPFNRWKIRGPLAGNVRLCITHFLSPVYFPYFPYSVCSSFFSDDIHRCLVFHHDTKRELTSIHRGTTHFLSLFAQQSSQRCRYSERTRVDS